MNAVIWEGVNRLSFRTDVPEPECPPDWVKVRVMSAGVCSTDVHIVKGKLPMVESPALLGHEISGVVEETGCNVRHFKPGDRVVVETVVSCGSCIHCRTGNKHLCADAREIGLSQQFAGGYAQYVSVPSGCLHRLPDALSFDEGGILEAMVCPFGAIYRLGMRLNETVLIQGVGIAGLSFLQAVKCFSPARVIVAARNPARLAQAEKFGADVTVNTREENLTERVLKLTGQEGVSLSIDAAGAAETIEQAVKFTAKGGRCILYGLPQENADIRFPALDMILRQITVTGVTNNDLAWEPLMELAQRGRINVRDMVTHVFPLSRLSEAIDLAESRPDGLIKAVVHPWEQEQTEEERKNKEEEDV